MKDTKETAIDLKMWVRSLPHSKMVFPVELSHKIKYVICHLYTPYHYIVRDTLLVTGIVKKLKELYIPPSGRQDYLFGTIAPHLSIQQFVSSLVEKGFANHFIAWKDDGEVVSLRFVENFIYQYHIRVFEDREVRGHYEYTPECYPLLHLRKIGQEERREEFFKFLGETVVRKD